METPGREYLRQGKRAMSMGTQAMIGGVFMVVVGSTAKAAFQRDFGPFLVPIWFIGVMVFGVGLWTRVSDP